MLSVDGLSVRYIGEERFAIQNLSLCCETGGITALVGRSGVGKTTLLAMAAGIYRRDDPMIAQCDGTIRLNERCPRELGGPEHVSWVPQAPLLLDHLTVRDNILLPLVLSALPCDDSLQKELFSALELTSYVDARPRALSGGTKAKVSLARALISQPAHLFLDEPFVGIDLMSRWKIYRLLWRQRGDRAHATILTTHNIAEAAVIASRIVILTACPEGTASKVVENSPTLENFSDPTECLAAARAISGPLEQLIFFE